MGEPESTMSTIVDLQKQQSGSRPLIRLRRPTIIGWACREAQLMAQQAQQAIMH